MTSVEHHSRIAVYPGSFDPLTIGHLDIARRAAYLFDSLIIAIYAFPDKNLLFSVDERLALWQEVIHEESLANVRVEKYTGLTVDYIRAIGGHVLIKGLRSSKDFEYEFQQGLMNRRLAPEIDTVCLFTNQNHIFISSSLLKEVNRLGGDVSTMLPAPVLQALQRKYGSS